MAEKPGAPRGQDEETRSALLAAAPAGAGTATGQAKLDDSGEEAKRLEGAPRRAEQDMTDGVGADYAPAKGSKPKGLQKEPAAFGVNGTIPAGMVASSSGHVPASSVGDPKAAMETTLGRQPIGGDYEALDEDLVASLNGPELRAIAASRGYDVGDVGGARTTRARFLAAQDKDEAFRPAKGGHSQTK